MVVAGFKSLCAVRGLFFVLWFCGSCGALLRTDNSNENHSDYGHDE